jgi:YrbI family 3-deoxy-D-manno-octulosonate 8-phosphate phosphatase
LAAKKNFKKNLLSKIKLLVLDVDGVLTDGGMYYTESGDEFKKFNAKDGIAVKKLVKNGIPVALLSSGINKTIIRNRAERLNIKYFHAGLEPKTQILDVWRRELGIEYSQIAYIGDDVNDLEVIAKCGITFCPSDAVPKVKKAVDIALKTKGGDGCVRELIEKYFLEI